MAVIDYSDWDSVNKVEYYKRQNAANQQAAPAEQNKEQNQQQNQQQQPEQKQEQNQQQQEQKPANTQVVNASPVAAQTTVLPDDNAISTVVPTATKTVSATKTTSKHTSTPTSKTDKLENENEGKESGNSTKVIGYVVGGIVALIIFLLIVKIYRRTKINRYRNRKKTIRKNDTTRNANINKVPTISYGNATSIY